MTTERDSAWDAMHDERAKWLIETLLARDFDIPEFHALQVEIARRWQKDRTAQAEARVPVAYAETPCPNCGSHNHVQRIIAEDGAELPIRHCNACGEEWENDDTFRSRNERINRTEAREPARVPPAPSESAPADIVARLRGYYAGSGAPSLLMNEAAATIERLQAHILTMRQVRQEQDAVIDRADAENAQLRETVERQAGVIAAADAMRNAWLTTTHGFVPHPVGVYDAARKEIGP